LDMVAPKDGIVCYLRINCFSFIGWSCCIVPAETGYWPLVHEISILWGLILIII
jgi:hypothetical protein